MRDIEDLGNMAQFDSVAFLDHLQSSVERTSDRRGFDCPICESSEWTIVDGTTPLKIAAGDVGQIHAVPVVCANCGFIAQFAVGQDS